MKGFKSQYLEDFCSEHEVALEFHLRRNGSLKVMEEPTELQYPFDELYQHIQDIHDNADFLREGLGGYLNAGKSKKLKHEKCVKMQRAIGELMSLVNGLECRFNAIEWPEYKHPLPDRDKDEIVFLTDYERPVRCGEAANKKLIDKEMF